MMENRKKISIGIPTYNRPYFLRQAIQSLVTQTRLPDEVIILDDNPTSSENHEVVSEFQKKYSFIKYIRNERRLGSSENYKRLLHLAEGDYVQLMGDDDILFPRAIEMFEEAFESSPEIVAVCSRKIFIDKKMNPIINLPLWERMYRHFNIFCDMAMDGRDFIKLSITLVRNLCVSFPMIKRSEIDSEPFRFLEHEFTFNADWFLSMSILRKGGKIFLLKDVLFGFRLAENEQLQIEKRVTGIKELMIFLSDEFLNYCGVVLSKREQAAAIENVLADAFLIKRSINKLGENLSPDVRERFFKELDTEVIKFAEKLKREASDTVSLNLRRKDRSPFSIIIVTYNNEDTIEQCIKSFYQTLRQDDEVIIVDNDSQDRTRDIITRLAEKRKNIRIILNKENVFFAKAVNQGVKMSKNRFLVFLNPDTEVTTPDWLELFFDVLKRSDVGAVGPVSDKAMHKSSLSLYSLFHWELTPIWMRNFFDEFQEETDFIPGFCIATKKEVFEQLGYFDEDLILGMDDFDYCLKLKEAGFKIFVIPSVFVRHRWNVSFKRNEDAQRVNEISIINFAKKLSKKFGYGNVPVPERMFFELPHHFGPYEFMKLRRYKFLFNFSETEKNKIFFSQRARILINRPPISVVTVNHKSCDDLKELIDSLIASGYPRINFVVIDNSEDDEEFARVQKLADMFKDGRRMFVIRTDNNGFAAGCNVGIKFAKEELKSEYIWLLNPDTVVNKDTPYELLKTVLYTDVPVVTCKIKIYGTDYVQYNGQMASEQPMEDKDFGIFKANFLSGANIFFRSDVFEKVGMFREDYFLYFEDNELFERLKKNNIYPLYTPYTFIYHKVKGKYGILEKEVSLYYFVRNMLSFFYELVQSGEKERNVFFNIVDKIRGIFFTTLTLGFEKSCKSVVLGIYDFISGKKGKNQGIQKEIEKTPDDIISELSQIDIGKRGERMPIEKYMLLMKLNLLSSPNLALFERYVDGLLTFLFKDVLETDSIFV